ncbi:MAG: hypothetical protein R2844_16280 [Caldilineales bacterium]
MREARFHRQDAGPARAAADTAARAALFYSKGIAEFLTDQTAAAERSLTVPLALSRELDLKLGQAGAQYYLGRLAVVAGQPERAEAQIEAAAAILLEAGELADWSHVISVLAEIVMFRGDLQRSRDLHMQALGSDLPPQQRHKTAASVGGLAELAMVQESTPKPSGWPRSVWPCAGGATTRPRPPGR